jgi:hypothetical protein
MCESRLSSWLSTAAVRTISVAVAAALAAGQGLAQETSELEMAQVEEVGKFEPIDSSVFTDCHEESAHGTDFNTDLQHSVHDGMECLDCHVDRDTVPHRVADQPFHVGYEGCRSCHDEASEQYQAHGRAARGTCEDIPH